ncbi:MAG: hypothetical protein ACT4P5_04270 [Armatimonadota bacterium]
MTRFLRASRDVLSGGARHFTWGIAAAGFYIIVVVASFHGGLVPTLPLYDGLAPPFPYRWVNPPPEVFFENEPPEVGRGSIMLTPSGSQPISIITGDAQAGVIVPKGAIAPRTGESSATVTITPLDPAVVVPEAVRARVNGNAYRIEIVYAASGEPVVLRGTVTVLLRYPIHATEMLQSAEPEWTALETNVSPASLQIHAQTSRLGTFVATNVPGYRPGLKTFLQQPLVAILGVVLSIVSVVVVTALLIAELRRSAARKRPPRN